MKTLTTDYENKNGIKLPHWEIALITINPELQMVEARFRGYVVTPEGKVPAEGKIIKIPIADIDLDANIADQVLTIFTGNKIFTDFTTDVVAAVPK